MGVSARTGGMRDSAFGKSQAQLRFPNPGDIFIMVALAWATLCFLMVVGGNQIARRLVVLTGSQLLRNALLTEQTALAVIMIAGVIGLGIAFYFIAAYRQATIAVFIFAMTFAGASWEPVYLASFVSKYLILIYLGAFSVLFIIRNGWLLVGTDGYRLVCFYIGWIALVVLITGVSFQNVWYLATEFTLMVGFGIAWLYDVDNEERLERLAKTFAYVGLAATFCHALAIVVAPSYTFNGRFIGMLGSGRATGFAVIFSVLVVAMFWMSMYEKDGFKQRLFSIVAFIGLGMILWSGSRNATVATLIGIGTLWWVLRTKLMIYILFAGMLGLLIQIILGDNQDVTMLSDRLASTENSRLGAWELYIGLIAESPLYGYGYDGLVSAVIGESLTGLLSSYVRLTIPGVHNLYIGFGARWGLVGLALQLALFYFPARVAWQVIFSTRVPRHNKRVYVLPVAMLLLVALQGLFEDIMGSTGRGTLHGIVYALGIPVVYLYGKKLLAECAENTVRSSRSAAHRRLSTESTVES